MNTKVSNQISRVEEEDITNIRHEPGEKPEGSLTRFFRPIVKWFGFLSTIAWGVTAWSPGILKVPAHLQGWIFVISILWLFSYCAGLFNP